MTNESKGAAVSPVTLAVVWNRMLASVHDCGERVMYSAQSMIMALARDLGPVIVSTEGDIVFSADFQPHHTLVAEIPTKRILEYLGKLEPGDMALANDAHIVQGGHLLDWIYLLPIYWHDELVFYGHFKGHMADSGGAYSGGYFPGTYDCYGEGLNIPPIKIFNKGAVNEEARKIILNNVRTPAAVWADIELIHGSLLKLQDDVCGLIDRFGLDEIKACVTEIVRRDEIATREQINKIPDGEYYGESAADWDGTTPDKMVFIRVKLTVKGSEMTFDFSDSDDQVEFINVPLGTTISSVLPELFLMLDSSMPHNYGAEKAVHIIAPSGKVVNPTRPHTYGACGCCLGIQIMEACSHALAQAWPERAMGDWTRHFSANVSGRLAEVDPRTGKFREYYQVPFIEEGGSGAVKGFDGWDGVGGIPGMGVGLRGSVEEQELLYPALFEVVQLAEDSEGAGEFIGARGTYCERICTAPPGSRQMLQTGDIPGCIWPLMGVAGAPPVPAGTLHIIRGKNKEKEVIKAIDLNEFYEGDVLYTKCYGGGGWGNPLNRDPEKVKLNAMEGLLSFERAREVYGVVLTQKDKENPKTIEVNYETTEELRQKRKAK
jgi:N-methylhydantoinase B